MMVQRWAVAEEVAVALVDAFGIVAYFFARLFSGHGTGHRMEGRGPFRNKKIWTSRFFGLHYLLVQY